MPVSVVIADDHTLVRQGLRRFLESADDVDVVGEAGDGGEAVAMVSEHRPDIALLDIRMHGMDGLEATRRISERNPETAVVILTGHAEEHLAVQAMQAGARGYVLKARDLEHLLHTVRMVARGNLVIDSDAVPAVKGRLRENGEGRRGLYGLTAREMDVLELLSEGRTNREIAEVLYVSPDTVKTHLEHIYQKLDTPDRTAAVAEALRRQLID